MADEKIIVLQRSETGDFGTFGFLRVSSGHLLRTLELPWRDNKPDLSCIPSGSYPCSLAYSPHFEMQVYHVNNVPGRASVEIHKGNWGGDTTKGYRSDVLGCIILGMMKVEVQGQLGIVESAEAFGEFMDALAGEPFTLQILPVPGESF